MAYINLTKDLIKVYAESAFIGLTQVNSTWFADSVKTEEAIAQFPPAVPGGAIITTGCTRAAGGENGILLVEPFYTGLTGLPLDIKPADLFILEAPLLALIKASGHTLANQFVAPFKTIHCVSNGALVFGCLGFTK